MDDEYVTLSYRANVLSLLYMILGSVLGQPFGIVPILVGIVHAGLAVYFAWAVREKHSER